MMQGEEVDTDSFHLEDIEALPGCRKVSGAHQVCDAGLEGPGEGCETAPLGKV